MVTCHLFGYTIISPHLITTTDSNIPMTKQEQILLDNSVSAEGKEQVEEETRRLAEEASKGNEELVTETRENNNKEASAVPSGKTFTVDPDSKVGVGIVPDITGPKLDRPDQLIRYDPAIGRSQCTRCKKEYTIVDSKVFKLCPHCRDLQRQRSKRWQQKTKLKEGACRRCGTNIPPDQSRFVLCPPCRLSLRSRKSQRYENGKCIHCAGANDTVEYKVCSRCRNNDKLRRKQLEDANRCNRCGDPLAGDSRGRKVCEGCRSRKKNLSKSVEAAAAVVVASHGAVEVSNQSRNETAAFQQVQAQLAQQAQEQAAAAQIEADNNGQLENNLFAQTQQ